MAGDGIDRVSGACSGPVAEKGVNAFWPATLCTFLHAGTLRPRIRIARSTSHAPGPIAATVTVPGSTCVCPASCTTAEHTPATCARPTSACLWYTMWPVQTEHSAPGDPRTTRLTGHRGTGPSIQLWADRPPPTSQQVPEAVVQLEIVGSS